MSMSDLIADSLTRLRNAQAAGHETVEITRTKVVEDILKILKNEGYIANFNFQEQGARRVVKVDLKYYENGPVIRGIERVSKPGRRIYQSVQDIRPALNNIGINIFSTSKGVITGKEAKLQNVGGEYICKVW